MQLYNAEIEGGSGTLKVKLNAAINSNKHCEINSWVGLLLNQYGTTWIARTVKIYNVCDLDRITFFKSQISVRSF